MQPDANPARPSKSASSAAAAKDCASRGRNLLRNPATPSRPSAASQRPKSGAPRAAPEPGAPAGGASASEVLVVLMLNVLVAALLPGVTDPGVKVPIAKVGKPDALSVTALGKPPVSGVTVIVKLAVAPALTVAVEGEAAIEEKSKPVPVSPAACGLPEALSLTISAAARLPEAVGLNVTLAVQFAPAFKLAPQVFVCEKSPAFTPWMAMLLIVSVALPLLVSVTVCAALVEPTA